MHYVASLRLDDVERTSRANGISERESADQPNCEADQDIGHTLAHATAIPRANATATIGQTINDNRGHEIAPEPTGHGLPLGKCEAYNRVYDQPYGSS